MACSKHLDMLTRVPVGFHNGPSSLVQFYAAMHVASATSNLFKVENVLGDLPRSQGGYGIGR
jgi:hypothetical protein